MKSNIKLTEKQIVEIKELADKTRKEMGVYSDVAIADDLLMLLEKKGIIVCEYPFAEDVHIDANITIFENDGDQLVFIGLNSNLYYDEQIFALAHELYHYQTKTGMAFQTDVDMEDAVVERMADRYSAELLLPGDVLRRSIKKTFRGQDINEITELRTLRFVARLQVEWWLPYRSIIIRMFEEGGLSQERCETFLSTDCRDENGKYARIFKSIDPDKFLLLNNKSRKLSISNTILEIIIRNFEDGDISEGEFIKLLALFGKDPTDFGFDVNAIIDDEELREFFEDGEAYEG